MTELSKEEREVFEKGWKDFSWGIEDPDDPTCIPLEFFQLGIQTERNKHRWINENKRLRDNLIAEQVFLASSQIDIIIACIETQHRRRSEMTELSKEERWISVKERLPEYIDEKDYSENVFTWNGKFIRVMARCYEYDGWLWGDCMGDIYGDPEVDDDYSDVTHWMPLPAPPKGDAVQSLIEEQLKGVKE